MGKQIESGSENEWLVRYAEVERSLRELEDLHSRVIERVYSQQNHYTPGDVTYNLLEWIIDMLKPSTEKRLEVLFHRVAVECGGYSKEDIDEFFKATVVLLREEGLLQE